MEYIIIKLLDTLNDGNVVWKARVFEVSSPMDLSIEDGSYDYIVVWSVFHHIEPNNWSEFLDSFFDLLKKGWKMIITGWDETDKMLEKNWFKWYITWRSVYPINGLLDYLDTKKCDVVEMWTCSEKISEFNMSIIFRYYILERK